MEDSPEFVNESPYENAWMIKVEPSDSAEKAACAEAAEPSEAAEEAAFAEEAESSDDGEEVLVPGFIKKAALEGSSLLLQEEYQAFKNNIAGGVLPIFFKDGDTGTTFISGSCTIMTLPSIVKGREASGREWVLTTGQAEVVIGSAKTAF